MENTNDERERMGIVGSGTVAVQLATFLSKWYDIVIRVRDHSKAEGLVKDISALAERWKQSTPDNVMIATDYRDLAGCIVVIEAVNEDLSKKMTTFADLESALPANTYLWTTTSSIPLGRITSGLDHPERCLGFHPFVPINRMNLIEVIRGPRTNREAVDFATRITERLGKVPIVIDDRPGFVVNRLLFIQLGEALKMLDERYASVEDIDRSVKLGLNHPMGPFELMDLIGLDICQSIFISTLDLSGDAHFSRSKALEMLIEKGMLGRKCGKGFYEYEKGKALRTNVILRS